MMIRRLGGGSHGGIDQVVGQVAKNHQVVLVRDQPVEIGAPNMICIKIIDNEKVREIFYFFLVTNRLYI